VSVPSAVACPDPDGARIAAANAPRRSVHLANTGHFLTAALFAVRPTRLRVYGAARRFLYDATLDRPQVMQRIPYPRGVPEHLPEVLSPPAVAQLLAAASSFKPTFRTSHT
jgi:hypothetical protein